MARGFVISSLLFLSLSAWAQQGPGPEIKFTYDSKENLFKDEKEALEYQALFDSYKESKEIVEYLEKAKAAQRKKMDEMRESGKRPESLEIKTAQFDLLKEVKNILEKKKKEKVSIAQNDVKCAEGKAIPVLEKETTDSMKDSTKVTKIILSDSEMKKIKEEIKAELKKEMASSNDDERPRRQERKRKDEERNEERNDENARPRGKMAQSKGRSRIDMNQAVSQMNQEMLRNFQSQSGSSGGMNMYASQMNMQGMGGGQMNMNMNMNMGMGMNQNQNQMNMGGFQQMQQMQPMQQMQMNPMPRQMAGYNFMAPRSNSSYTYGNSMMNPYADSNSLSGYASQIGIPYNQSSFAQMGY